MVLEQGTILKLEKQRIPVLVVSKEFFNESGVVIACPIYSEGEEGVLHRHIYTDDLEGYVHCDKLRPIDLDTRGYSVVSTIDTLTLMDISDIIQGIFDYI